MPITVKLDDVLYARRMTLTELSERVIRFSTLEAVCEALQCQPGDLLEYVPGPPTPDDD
jgi:putative transcriptional regulator